MDDALKREKTSCPMEVAFLQAASPRFSGSLRSVSNHCIHCSTTFNNNPGLSGMTDCDSPATACQSAGPPTLRQGLSRAVGAGEKGSEGKESSCIKRNNRRSCFRIGLTFFLPSEACSLYLVLRNYSALAFSKVLVLAKLASITEIL